MANIRKSVDSKPSTPASLQNAVRGAEARGLLSEKGVQALTDGDISREDKQMANEVLAKAFDRAGEAGANKDPGELGKAVGDAGVAKNLADATMQQFYKENPAMGASMMAKLGSFIDKTTLSMHKTTLSNLGGVAR